MRKQTVPSMLELIWRQGYFQVERTLPDIARELGSLGTNPTSQNLDYALSHASFLTRRGKRGSMRYIQKHSSAGISTRQDVLPAELLASLNKDFRIELSDLKHNFGISGTCTAFLLRKILEKLLFLVLSKRGFSARLVDPSGKHIGLHAMISLAATVRISGKPILTQQTADRIAPIKFLGDAAAHNPLANVPMSTIEREMAYIITAYLELSSWL